MDSYQKALGALNTEQRAAVEQIEGPLLVIAGPGTGKTQLLSVRVAYILKHTDSAPENVLCLTFTNKAATNMRDRLFDLIGPAAYKVCVKTFHSFAADIMNEYPDCFWGGARLSVVPDAVQLEIIQSILMKLPLENPLAKRFAGELTGTRDVLEALKLSKEAGLTPDKLQAVIAANLAYIDAIETSVVEALSETLSFKKLAQVQAKIEALPEQPIDELIAPLQSLRTVLVESLQQAIEQDMPLGKTTHTGAWKRRFISTVNGVKGMHAERQRNAWWLELAAVYGQYREALHARGYYDYADMLVEVITQIEQHPELRSDIQERYNYVLIDEFQDTNPAQMRLAHLVADHHSMNGRPNLMAVGDDDQSIYKFNGAELNNMLGFRSFYKIEKPVVLVKNYRSSQAILDVAKLIAEQASDRIVHREKDITKELVAANAPRVQGTISHTVYPTREHQLSAVARLAAEQQARGGEVAILARGHDSLFAIAGILHEIGAPIAYERQNDALQHPLVAHIVLLAQLLVALHRGDEDASNVHLSKLLCSDMWGVDSTTLWQLAIQNRYRPHWLRSLLEHEQKQLAELAHNLLELSRIVQAVPLTLMMDYLIGLRPYNTFTSPIRNAYFDKKPVDSVYMEALSALQLLIELSSDFAAAPQATLADFVRFIELNQTNSQPLTDTSVFQTGKDAIQLLTVHKAKGLEFDCVYVVDVNEELWRPRSGGRKPPANLPLQAYGDDMDDYVRLFYVAATRAKHSLFVSCFASGTDGKDMLPASFSRAAIPPITVPLEDAGEPVQVLEQRLTWPQLTHQKELAVLRPLLDDFSLSATALLRFLDVTSGGPQYFKERSLLGLPEAKTMSQAHGTAIHAALETAQRLTNAGAFDIDEVLQTYEDTLEKEHIDIDEFERYVPLGQKTLYNLFEGYEYRLQPGSASEQSLSCTLPGNINLSGTLDRIDLQDKTKLVIADYKTGAPIPSFTTQDKSKAVKVWRHRTQLIFYAILAQETPRFSAYKAIECQMVYVESEDARHLVQSLTPTEDDIAHVKQLIAAVWRHIQAGSFPDTSNYSQDIAGIRQFEQDVLA